MITVATPKNKRKSSKKAKVKSPDLKHWLTNKLRRLSYQWPARREAIKKARTERGKYTCNICEGTFGPKEINVDHIIPVIDPHTGFQDWHQYITRLFCEIEGLQICCVNCHKTKTFFEEAVRKQVKRSIKRQSEDDGDI